MILRLEIEGADTGHANLLFIDKQKQEYERFEPNGSSNWERFAWVDSVLAQKLPEHLPPDYEFMMTPETCPQIGPQLKAGMPTEGKCQKEGGYCVVFSTLCAHLRMMNPNLSGAEIYSAWMELSSTELMDLIQRYETWMATVVPGRYEQEKFEAFRKKYMKGVPLEKRLENGEHTTTDCGKVQDLMKKQEQENKVAIEIWKTEAEKQKKIAESLKNKSLCVIC